jgi:hypothetical protein
MILLQEIFDTLATGEFSHIKLGNSLQGTITEADYPKMVAAVNLGLLDLHKKFPLRKGEFIVHQHPAVTNYYLRKEHAASLSEMGAELYIEIGEEDSFPQDFLHVSSLWQADGVEIPLNDPAQKTLGGFTPSFDTLKMIPRQPPIAVHVEYRARYPQIVITESFAPEKVQLHIPDFIVEPLLYFVASRVFRGIASKATEGETTSAITYHTLYRTACLEIQHLGLVTPDDSASEQFSNHGWV